MQQITLLFKISRLRMHPKYLSYNKLAAISLIPMKNMSKFYHNYRPN